MPRFETHSHSYYSNLRLLDAINSPSDLIQTAAKLGYKGIALTDHESLSGSVVWLNEEKKLKEKGTIPGDFVCALGDEIYLTETRNKAQKYFHFILIAKDTIGFRQLCRISSQAWLNSYFDRGMERVPVLKEELREIIGDEKGHLIAQTACLGSELAELSRKLDLPEEKEQTRRKVEAFFEYCLDLFGDDFYLEVAPASNLEQIVYNRWIKKFSKMFGVKIVIGCDAHYLVAEDRFIHKAYLNSKEGEREVDGFYEFAYLQDDDTARKHLKDVFSDEEFEELCANSLEEMSKIGKYEIFHNPIIPEVNVKNYPPIEVNDAALREHELLRSLFASDNIQERYWVNECWNALAAKKLVNEKYVARLETEADIIKTVGTKLGNCLFSYFNTFQHFIDLFWECGSIVGPGRGSAVAFLSNYLLGITQLDPVEWGLNEWRFLNKERLELPDIDIDLCPSKRPLIFQKIREEFGEINLLQVATFGTEGSRSAVLTAARGYRSKDYPEGINVDDAQYIASLIPSERGFTRSIKEMVEGNKEKGIEPNQTFINECEKYPGFLEIVKRIEGITNKRSQHASGVILYTNSPYDTTAIMRSPNGNLTTQFELHQSEQLGDTKFDFLLTEICDKITTAIRLLQQDNLIEHDLSLREVYNKYLHPSVLDVKDDRLWDALGRGEVTDVFQFNTDVGLQGVKQVQPRSPIEMMMTNALIRLVAEKGKERPMDRYVRMKNNIQEWYDECHAWGLSEEEIKILEPYYLPVGGTPTTQEKLMLLCMDEKIAHFTLKEANNARKICAKKKLSEIPALHEKFISNCANENFGEYVWETAVAPQMSYAFAEPHALAYSFVGIQTLYLAVNFPAIYWNCACLISNSGATELFDRSLEHNVQDEFEEEEIEGIYESEDADYVYVDAPDRSSKTKLKAKTVDFGRVATAIGTFQHRGIAITPPNINKSSFTFSPDAKNNTIVYGLYGLTRISADLVNTIIENRPYTSYEDFRARVKTTKPQIITLIKSGAFDDFEPDRAKLLRDYAAELAETKKNLTLANIPSLLEYNVLPEEAAEYIELYQFNKFLNKNKRDKVIFLTSHALSYYLEKFDADVLQSENTLLEKDWKRQYDKAIEPLRQFIKDNRDTLLDELNNKLIEEQVLQICQGNISKWEMEAMSFYYHDHELANIDPDYYDVIPFDELPEDPQIDKIIKGDIKLYKLSCIYGTVLDKNKIKNSISLLTPDGVVNVKIWKNQYAKYDKQISAIQPDGKKKVMERSWFSRGTLLFIQGIRRNDTFIPKAYKSSKHRVPIMKIVGIDGDHFDYIDERYDE